MAQQQEVPLAEAAANPRPLRRRKFHKRDFDDAGPQSWWIASTAIPLVAAAAGPLANVMSVVALVLSWRSVVVSEEEGPAAKSIQKGYADPHW